MHDLIHQFLEAHVAHELNRFKDNGYIQTIKEEVSAVFEWVKKIKLKDVMPVEQILGLIKRNVVELPVAGGVTELAGEMSQKVLASRQNKKTSLEDIFARKQYDDIVDKVVSLKKARDDSIRRFVNSSVYSQQISEVLFTGIKEYMLAENIIAKKVPGVSSLIKVGKFAVNKTMPSLEVAIEKKVKSYIESNLENTIRRSEKSIINYFDETRIVDTGEEIWESIAKTKLSEYFSAIDDNDMEDFIIIGYDFWLHFRNTKYFKGIYTELVKYFFKKYGDRELDVILEDIGVTRKMVINELIEIIAPGIEKALSIGYLEERIRARLESFYLSKKAASIISPKKTPPQKTKKTKKAKPK
ncbi:MAG: hypothetical protein HF978_14345 [Desulfobacteraceae bacterium]|nr:hypothetical protein [Desulfobacteraceae bacterium]MBC2756719.1 hypothetical protein [Desulfobacteraceae bacterium]